jgi:hypothetical protein
MIGKQQRLFLGLLLGGLVTNSLGSAAQPAQGTAQPAISAILQRPHRFVPIERVIRRDPFAGAPKANATPSPEDILVPDIDGDSDPTPQRPEYTLKATILGPVSVAYVAAGSVMQLVRVGDDIDERRVVAIDARGLTLSDGSRLDLPSLYAPASTPRARGAARRALTVPPAPTTSASVAGNVLVSATPASTVSAGPLPTLRPGAYPLDARPTSDPAAPTAFPYPYPYPPH